MEKRRAFGSDPQPPSPIFPPAGSAELDQQLGESYRAKDSAQSHPTSRHVANPSDDSNGDKSLQASTSESALPLSCEVLSADTFEDKNNLPNDVDSSDRRGVTVASDLRPPVAPPPAFNQVPGFVENASQPLRPTQSKPVGPPVPHVADPSYLSNGEENPITFPPPAASTSSYKPPSHYTFDNATKFARNFHSNRRSVTGDSVPQLALPNVREGSRNAAKPPSPHHVTSSPPHGTAFSSIAPHRQPHGSPFIPPSLASGPNVLTNAHHFDVQTINVYGSADVKNVFEYLNPHVAHGAAHDADVRSDAPMCYEKTREAVRNNIVNWIGGDEPTQMMWLSGPAGGGKTAIAGSVAETCKGKGLLAASFFFSSSSISASSRSKRCVIATIASQLAEHQALHEFTAQLLVSLKRSPSVFHKNLKEQAECLLLRPFRAIQGRRDITWPKGIIIDGLDEVEAQQYHDPTRHQIAREHDSDQVEILAVLFTLAADPNFPFRIFISSRREGVFQEFFSLIPKSSALQLSLDSKYNPNTDITTFLVDKFADIRRRFTTLNRSWPGQGTIDRIVTMASGQFIVPAVIIRYIEKGDSEQRLKGVLQLTGGTDAETSAFATLDALYSDILKRAHNCNDDPHMVVKWIRCIISGLTSRSNPPPAQFWRCFLENYGGEFDYRMGPITSLISVPPPEKPSSSIMVHHNSLVDFLSSEARCGDLYVDDGTFNSFVACRIVKVLQGKGPAPPLRPPTENLFEFLKYFRNLELLAPDDCTPPSPPDSLILEKHSRFLVFLSEASREDLASCDVASWTNILLDQIFFGDGLSFVFSPGDHGVELLGSTFCGVHHAMCASSISKIFPLRLNMLRKSRSRCHPACVHWRTEILARVKELGWCVRKVERVNLDRLQDMTIGQFKMKFHRKTSGPPRCTACHPEERRRWWWWVVQH